MNVNEALEFVDQRLCAKTGKHLNDIEKEVFVGSWHGRTYEEIYPQNPSYVEKTLAYRLWRKLSLALDEKVSKKQLKGAVERAWQKQRRVFISYRGQSSDHAIASTLAKFLQSLGYPTFVNDLDTLAPAASAALKTTQEPITQALWRCDCFVLLLSSQTAVSEMAIEQLRQLRQGVGLQGMPSPQLVVIRLASTQPLRLSHDLRNYLEGAYCWSWASTADTPQTVQRLQAILEQDAEAIKQLTLELLTAEDEILKPSNHTSSEPTRSDARAIDTNNTHTKNLALLPAVVHPLPGAEPEIPQGQVRADSKFYIERTPHEGQCHEAIGRSGALIRIKAPRQMGKTSLMARILSRARENGYQAIPVSFQHADRATFADLGSLLRWFCAIVARKLRLPHRLEDYWDETFGSKGNCTHYFEEYLLPEIKSPLVLGLDEVDEVFRYPTIADDFFGLLRAWYEEASYGSGNSELWERLRLVVVHSTEVYLPLDVNQSPFNVGLPIELSEFTLEQVTDLVRRHGLQLTLSAIETLMALVGGHPYLVRLALYYLVQERLTLAELCETGPTEAGIYGDHLRHHLATLKRNPELAQAYRAVLDASMPLPLDSESMFKLHSLGLVSLQGNKAVPSFELYRRYFSDRLQVPSA
ncbi:MAG: AAA-like domain-containing protein [Cyanobacteria bacterium J06639_14]